ncbi:MAG: hypothetical protein R3F45_02585 [Gammaproteobacteria bacterium]
MDRFHLVVDVADRVKGAPKAAFIRQLMGEAAHGAQAIHRASWPGSAGRPRLEMAVLRATGGRHPPARLTAEVADPQRLHWVSMFTRNPCCGTPGLTTHSSARYREHITDVPIRSPAVPMVVR